jgi:hypothetical protein
MSVCEKLRVAGIVTRQAAAVLYAMALNDISYEAARDAYADYMGIASEQLQAALCYDTLNAGHDISPEELFSQLMGEVRP